MWQLTILITNYTRSHLGRGKLDLRRPCWLLRRLWEKDRTTGPGCTRRGREPAACLLCRLATCSDRTKICTSPEIVKLISFWSSIDCYYRGHTTTPPHHNTTTILTRRDRHETTRLDNFHFADSTLLCTRWGWAGVGPVWCLIKTSSRISLISEVNVSVKMRQSSSELQTQSFQHKNFPRQSSKIGPESWGTSDRRGNLLLNEQWIEYIWRDHAWVGCIVLSNQRKI